MKLGHNATSDLCYRPNTQWRQELKQLTSSIPVPNQFRACFLGEGAESYLSQTTMLLYRALFVSASLCIFVFHEFGNRCIRVRTECNLCACNFVCATLRNLWSETAELLELHCGFGIKDAVGFNRCHLHVFRDIRNAELIRGVRNWFHCDLSRKFAAISKVTLRTLLK